MNMRKLLSSLALACAAAFPAAAQHSLDTLEIYVLLNRDGSAYVEEQRNMYAGADGTECYIRMYNMGDMEVSDLEVWEKGITDDGRDTTITYVNDGVWDINRTRTQKTYHCGINEVAEGLEMCWGLGGSGRHKYYVSYTLKGLVKGYSDFDGFNHNFYQADNPTADYARVVIRLGEDYRRYMAQTADSLFEIPRREKNCNVSGRLLTIADKVDTSLVERYSLVNMYVEEDTLCHDTASIWAFGYYGNIIFSNGFVVAETDRSMSQGDKMIVMCRFKKGLFSPTLTYPDQTFEKDVRELAFIDSDYPLDDDGSGSASSLFGGDTTPLWERILYMVLGGVCCVGLPLFVIIYALFGSKISEWMDRRRVRRLLKGAPKYYNEPPLGGQLIKSRRILRAMESSVDTSEMKLIEALVLRLIDKQLITLVHEQNAKGEVKQLFRIEEPALAETVLSAENVDNSLLKQLHSLLYKAAGSDFLLQPSELRQMAEDEPLTVRPFAQCLRSINERKLEPEQIRRDEAQQVFGFWNYLKDFSLVGERALQEVALWKEYLTFATLFGIAEQVRDDMKRLAPDLKVFDQLTRDIVENTNTAVIYNSLSSSIMDAARRTVNYETVSERIARREREARWARSSGGGGRSSYGGGGGFSGGGGSGVR